MSISRMVFALLVSILILVSCEAPPDGAYTVTGSVEIANAPAGSSVFVIASDTDNYQDLMDAPLDHILAMSMTEPDGDYTLDLTDSWAYAGDEVFLFAFAFPGYSGEMPMPDIGDYVGLYLKNDGSDPAFSLVLQAGETVADTSGDWEFQLIRTVRDFTRYLEFVLDPNLPGGGEVQNGDRLFIVVVEEQGLASGTREISDLNYVAGMKEQLYDDTAPSITIQLLDILHENIVDPENMNVCLYVIHDTDGSGTINTGDEVATYWETYLIFLKRPKFWTIQPAETNVLDQNVEFIDQQV